MNSLSFISLTGAALCFLSSLLPAAVPAVPTGAERMVFPRDPSVLDLQRDFGAKGDGVADDTAALQTAIEASSNRGRVGGTAVLFVPNGTYLVTSNLVINSRVGPWLYGESRDGVVIRLTDGVATNVTAVLRTQPSDTQASSADYFMRNFRHLTIDVGRNPHADGIRWYANNSGILKDVRITGTGRVAINAGFLGQNGPSLIQDALVEGSFETGVRCAWSWGQTLSRVTVRNARLEGVYVNATAVGIEDLVVENTPVALRNEYPNDWTWWGGVVALVGGRFTGGDPNQPAITNTSVLYARDVEAVGFRQVLDGTTPGGGVSGNTLREYTSHPVKKLFADSPDASLHLPIWPEPRVPWETDLANWVCANDHGAAYGDNRDDTAALQAAIDHAAAAGKTVVYLRGISGGDPNWYTIDGEVRLRGSVQLVIGLGFGRVIGGPSGRFIVDDRSAPVVKFMHLQAFGGRPPVVENRSTTNTLVVESCDLRVLGTGSGDIFVTDCPAGIELRAPGQRLWARQLNPEGDSDTGLVQNHGGRLWALGVKHEGRGVRFRTDQGGQTEILGWFNYPPDIAKDDRRPAFDVANAAFSAAGVREMSFGNTYPVKVREARGDDVRSEEGGGWIGWSLYSGRATTAAATGSGLAVEEAGRQASIIVPLAELPPGARPLEMVAISSGSFQMGCPVDERGRVGREWPPHRVTITRAFQLGKYEVTQAQWRTVMGTSPAEGYGVGDDHPVYNVTWNDARQFIARLNAMGKGTFRLPTEAEWEYACRAGTTTRFSFGDALESSDVRDYDPLLDTHLWWGGNNGQHGYPKGAKQVGLKTPNPWGVHDLHGNVWEYCSDWWETAEDRGARTDPQGPASGTHKVMRGGAWESHALHLRSADRSLAPPDGTEYGRLIGLRLVREHP